MKLRTLDAFGQHLDDEFAWRRKELSAIWADVKSAKQHTKEMRLRSGVALLYAHWEGFVKQAAEAFLSYVNLKRLRRDELSLPFLALSLWEEAKDHKNLDEATRYLCIARFFVSELNEKAKLPVEGVAKTGSNLNSVRLKAIVLSMGLDYSPYELKENLLDSELLRWRNSIAHGKALCPAERDFDLLYAEVTDLMRVLKDQLQNAAALQSFRFRKDGGPVLTCA